MAAIAILNRTSRSLGTYLSNTFIVPAGNVGKKYRVVLDMTDAQLKTAWSLTLMLERLDPDTQQWVADSTVVKTGPWTSGLKEPTPRFTSEWGFDKPQNVRVSVSQSKTMGVGVSIEVV
jgi:hypothetical protein